MKKIILLLLILLLFISFSNAQERKKYFENGRLIEVGNKKMLIETLRKALNNEEETQKYATQLRQKIEDKFDRKYIYQELLKFYQEELSKLK